MVYSDTAEFVEWFFHLFLQLLTFASHFLIQTFGKHKSANSICSTCERGDRLRRRLGWDVRCVLSR